MTFELSGKGVGQKTDVVREIRRSVPNWIRERGIKSLHFGYILHGWFLTAIDYVCAKKRENEKVVYATIAIKIPIASRRNRSSGCRKGKSTNYLFASGMQHSECAG